MNKLNALILIALSTNFACYSWEWPLSSQKKTQAPIKKIAIRTAEKMIEEIKGGLNGYEETLLSRYEILNLMKEKLLLNTDENYVPAPIVESEVKIMTSRISNNTFFPTLPEKLQAIDTLRNNEMELENSPSTPHVRIAMHSGRISFGLLSSGHVLKYLDSGSCIFSFEDEKYPVQRDCSYQFSQMLPALEKNLNNIREEIDLLKQEIENTEKQQSSEI